jgi:hypothetical protein
MRVTYLCCLLTLAACPPKKTGPGGPLPPSGGVGCPPATDIYIVSYVTPEEPGKGATGWVLPLHDKTVDSLDGIGEYTKIDQAAATAAGVPAAPQNLWMLTPQGQPCKATIGSYYQAAVDAPTKNITYGVEVTGCAAPPDPQNASAIAVVSAEPPNQCTLIGPKSAAQRLGEVSKDGKWSRPTKETPIPPALDAVIPKKECAAPSCEKLWSLAQVEVGGKPIAWAGAVNWLQAPAGDTCEWKGERFSGFWLVGADGVPAKVTEGQNHPLALTAILADKTGPKALVAEGPGEYTTYALADGKATVAHHLVWLLPHPDSYDALDHLGPPCEQQQQQP